MTMAVLLCSITVSAYDFEVDGIYYRRTQFGDNPTVKVDYRGFIGNTYNDFYVGDIVIPETVSYDGVTYAVTAIGGNAFEGCNQVTSISMPSTITEIEQTAFYNCTRLAQINIPEGITWINNYTFENCRSLTSIDLPSTIKGIGTYAFLGCSKLETIQLPDNLTKIGSEAFSGCSNLQAINIPKGITVINEETFYNCASLQEINIPNGVTAINDMAFYGCTNLMAINIPESVTKIASNAYGNCSSITSIVVSEGNDVYDSRNNSHAIIETNTNILLRGCENTVIPNTVVKLSNSAFSGCTGLTTLVIPESLVEISANSFSACVNIESIRVEESHSKYDSRGNCNAIIETNSNKLVFGCKNTIIPNSIEVIGGNAFYGCTGLKEVVIPFGVKRIDGAFNKCKELSKVTIPNSIISMDYAFDECDNLKTIVSEVEVPYSKHLYDDDYKLTIDTIYIPKGSKKSYSFGYSSASLGICSCENILELDEKSVYLKDNMFALCSANNLDFTNIKGVKAYVIVEYDNVNNIVKCEQVKIVPANTGIILFGESNTEYKIPYTDKQPILSTNLLKCTITAKTINTTDGECANYVFEQNSFKKMETSKLLGNGEAYLQIPISSSLPETIELSFNKIILDNTTSFVQEIDEQCASITYTRTLNNLEWNALYVPFEIPVNQLIEDYEVAYINGIHSYDDDDNGEIDRMSMEVVKVKSGTLHANHPYLIKARTEEAKAMNITVNNTTLYKAENTTLDCSSVYMKYEITGIYEKMTESQLTGCYALSDGAWKQLASGSSLNPFRLYLKITDRGNSPVKVSPLAMTRIRIHVKGEETSTSIEELMMQEETNEEIIYDLMGRPVENPVKGHVYIVNGKKRVY